MKKSVAAVLTAGIMAAGVISSGLTVFAEDTEEKTYSVTYNLNDGNAEEMPNFQFISADMKGMTSYDSRAFYSNHGKPIHKIYPTTPLITHLAQCHLV